MYQERARRASYGLSPLEFAPTPTSFARPWFADEVIEVNLDHLEHEQQADGGWPIAWEPPSTAAHCDWRGIVTVQALEDPHRLRPAPCIRVRPTAGRRLSRAPRAAPR